MRKSGERKNVRKKEDQGKIGEHDGEGRSNVNRYETLVLEAEQQLVSMMEEKYNEICDAHSAYYTTAPLNLQTVPVLDAISRLIASGHQAVPKVLRALKVHPDYDIPPSWFKNIIPRSFMYPAAPDLSLLGYIPEQGRFATDSKVKYPVNMSAYMAKKIIDEHKNKSKKINNRGAQGQQGGALGRVTSDNALTHAGLSLLSARMAMLFGSQPRFSKVSKQVLTVLMTKQTRPSSTIRKFEGYVGDRVEKRGIDLVGMQVIRYVLRKHDTMPFLTSKRFTHPANVGDYSTLLPDFILSMLNICIMELSCILDHVSAKLVVANLAQHLSVSYMQGTLDRKDVLPTMWRELVCDAGQFSTLSVSKTGIICGKIHMADFREVDEVSLREKINEVKQDMNSRETEIFEFVKSMKPSSPDAISEWLVYSLILLQSAKSSGLYNKAPLFMHMDKSISPKFETHVRAPDVLESVYIEELNQWFPLSYDFSHCNDLMQNIYARMMKDVQTVGPDSAHRNVIGDVYSTMTMNSQGGVSPEDKLPGVLSTTTNKRRVFFLTHFDSWFNPEKVIEDAGKDLSLLLRYQIDRRPRPVAPVATVASTSTITNMNMFKAIAGIDSYIAVGNKSASLATHSLARAGSSYSQGGAMDMGDVTGMDTRTTQVIQSMHNGAAVAYSMYSKENRYLWAESKSRPVRNERSKIVTEREIPALTAHKLFMDSFLPGVNFVHKDLATKDIPGLPLTTPVTSSIEVFPSGALNTSAHHTHTLAAALHECLSMYNTRHVSSQDMRINIDAEVFGDDIAIYMYGSEAACISFKKFYREHLLTLNYPVTGEMSKVFTIFLQVQFFGGMHVPQPGRMSLFSDERSESLSKDVLVLTKEMQTLAREYASRTYSPDNMQSFIPSLWTSIRAHSIRYDLRLAGPVKSLSTRYPRMVDKPLVDGRTLICPPYMTVFWTPIFCPFPPITRVVEDVLYSTTGSTFVGVMGDAHVIKLLELFVPNTHLSLDTSLDSVVIEGEAGEGKCKVMGFSDVISHELWNELDMSAVNAYSSFNRALAEKRNHMDPEVEAYIEGMVKVATRTYSKNRLYASYLAAMELEQMQHIKQPSPGLLGVNMPRQSVESILEAIVVTDEVRFKVDCELIKWMHRSRTGIPKRYVDLFDSYYVSLTNTLHNAPYSSLDYSLASGLRSVPAYHENDSTGRLWAISGGHSRNGSLYHVARRTLVEELKAMQKDDRIIYDAIAVLNSCPLEQRANVMELLADAYMLGGAAKRAFIQVLTRDASCMLAVPYSSFPSNTLTMDIDTSFPELHKVIALENDYAAGRGDIMFQMIRNMSIVLADQLTLTPINCLARTMSMTAPAKTFAIFVRFNARKMERLTLRQAMAIVSSPLQ